MPLLFKSSTGCVYLSPMRRGCYVPVTSPCSHISTVPATPDGYQPIPCCGCSLPREPDAAMPHVRLVEGTGKHPLPNQAGWEWQRPGCNAKPGCTNPQEHVASLSCLPGSSPADPSSAVGNPSVFPSATSQPPASRFLGGFAGQEFSFRCKSRTSFRGSPLLYCRAHVATSAVPVQSFRDAIP